nr:PCI domain-containing protein [Candidatus Sigynarchaeota archaeon]
MDNKASPGKIVDESDILIHDISARVNVEGAKKAFKNSIYYSICFASVFSLVSILVGINSGDLLTGLSLIFAINWPVYLCLSITALRLRSRMGTYKAELAKAKELKNEERIERMAKGFDDETKNRLVQLFGKSNRINLKHIAAELYVDQKTVEMLIYQLAGENRIDGTLDDDGQTFILASNVSLDSFISALDSRFRSWGSSEKAKIGKI